MKKLPIANYYMQDDKSMNVLVKEIEFEEDKHHALKPLSDKYAPVIYEGTFGKVEWEKYSTYFRHKILDVYDILFEDYIMIEVDGRMYTRINKTGNYYKDLIIQCYPCDYMVEHSLNIDLLKTGLHHMIQVYPVGTLVAKYDNLYLDGNIIATRRDVIKKHNVDLQNCSRHLNKDHLMYLLGDAASRFEIKAFTNDNEQCWY